MVFIPRWERFRNKKPPGKVEVNWNNPISANLAICMVNFRSNLVNGFAPVKNGGLLSDDELVHDTITDYYELEPSADSTINTSDVSLLLGYKKTDAFTRASGAFGFLDDPTSSNRCGCYLPHEDGGVYFHFGGIVDGATRLAANGLSFGDDNWAFVASSTLSKMQIWKNGLSVASNTAAPTRTRGSTVKFRLGGGGFYSNSDLAIYKYFYAFNRVLSSDEIISINEAPYQLVKQVPKIFILPSTSSTFSSTSMLLGVG